MEIETDKSFSPSFQKWNFVGVSVRNLEFLHSMADTCDNRMEGKCRRGMSKCWPASGGWKQGLQSATRQDFADSGVYEPVRGSRDLGN